MVHISLHISVNNRILL